MSTAYELTGSVKLIGETQSFPSGFTKREIVITTTDDKYPQDIKIDFVKDGCDRLDALNVEDTAKIAFNIRGNEHNGKHYVSLQGWKIERVGEPLNAHNESKANGYQPQRATTQNGALPPSRTATADELDENDDIPF